MREYITSVWCYSSNPPHAAGCFITMHGDFCDAMDPVKKLQQERRLLKAEVVRVGKYGVPDGVARYIFHLGVFRWHRPGAKFNYKREDYEMPVAENLEDVPNVYIAM